MLGEGSACVAPEHVVLCAGTSEGYAHLFRLLADPGELVRMPAPGYPLFEHLAALEGVDTARSVSPLLAAALPGLLARRAVIVGELQARVASNRARLAAAIDGGAAVLLDAEAGWGAMLRVPGARDGEALALALLGRGLLVQPGFVFDLEARDPGDGPCAHLILSLLAEPRVFASGLSILSPFLETLEAAPTQI